MGKDMKGIDLFWNEETISKYEKGMSMVITEIEKIDKAYFEKTKSHCIRFIEKRLKDVDSVAQKLERKNRKSADENLEEFISDLAGVRVICYDIEQTYMIAEKIVEVEAFETLKIKDYIRKPKDNGYQSYHIIMRVQGIKVELQIRTILMDAWSSLDSILEYKKATPITSEMKNDIQKMAKWSRKMDKLVTKMIKQKLECQKFLIGGMGAYIESHSE
ncbi:MAG: GTP pyrophosphokinase family protein [Lachnospiraceae bacterium]